PPPTPPSAKDSPPPSPPPSPSPPSPKNSPPPSPSPPAPNNSPPPSPSPPNNSPPPSPSNTPPPTPPTPPGTSKDTPPQKNDPPPQPSPKDGSSSPPALSPPVTPGTPIAKEPPPADEQSSHGSLLTPPADDTPSGKSGGSSSHSPLGPSTTDSSSKSSPSDTNSTSPSSDSSSGSSNTSMIVGGVVVVGVAVLAFAILWLVCSKRRKRKQHQEQYYTTASQYYNNHHSMDHVIKFQSPPLQGVVGTPTSGGAGGEWGMTSGDYSVNYSGPYNQNQHLPNPSPLGGLGYSSQNQFSYQELATATSGFSQENLLGQGGFGYVHKGVLSDGREVAVKSLKSGSGQGEREFQAEVEIISRVHHRHLVSLVGYCIADGQRMLVYEFVPNKTLEHHLHGKGLPVMDWSSRMRIALGSAKGLAYLHEDCHPRIIHRDIKAANILLDENYEAMVADFGLAKLSSDNFTHVSTRVMGTFGYLAPEYASSGKLSDKSDVFSFGVMLLELITGRRPVDPTGKIMEDSLVDWSRPLMTKALEDGNYDEIADPYMEGNYVPDEMARIVACASASVHYSAKRRPRMSQIVRSLEGDLAIEDLNEGVKHAVNINPGPSTSSHDSAYDTGAYNADMMKFRKMIMNTQEIPSGSVFGTTSEYGWDPSNSDTKGKSGEYTRTDN
ncbi:hypothetical protein Leryth_006823, partial [Lithospermum erythrorhizon]